MNIQSNRQIWSNAASWMLALMPVFVLTYQRMAGFIGLAWLLFCLLAWIFRRPRDPMTHHWRNPAVIGFALFPLVLVVVHLLQGGSWNALHNPSRFLLVLPVLPVVVLLKPSPKWFFSACAMGGIYSAGLALWQVYFQELSQAFGFTNPNKFGYVAATFVAFCAVALRLRGTDRVSRVLLGVGLLSSLLAMVLSHTRGTWIALGVAMTAWLVLSRTAAWSRKLTVAGLVVAAFALLIVMDGNVVQQKVVQTSAEISKYLAGGWQESSVGERFELWRAAVFMIQQSPLTGVGLNQFNANLQALIADGLIDPQIADHGSAHNEFLGWFATAGVLGLLGVCASLLGPLLFFVRHADRAAKRWRAVCGIAEQQIRAARYRCCALAGCLFVTLTTVFCFSDAFFYIHFATVYYALTVILLVGLVQANAE